MPAQRLHGGPDACGAPLHDFSTNANACGPSPQALAAVRAADATRYPDPGYTALRESLAAFHGVAPARIALAASGSEFIFRITAWTRRHGARRVWLPPHAFGEYAHAAQAWGMEQGAQGGHEGGAGDAHLAWACEPSSPMGTADPRLEQLVANRGVVVLDRAYEPLRLSGSFSLGARQLDRLWQLWTPNKALGLTGVRAAYAIAPSGAAGDVIDLDAIGPSWPLGADGVAMLQAWCEPSVQRWVVESLAPLREWKQRQIGVCESLGWRVAPSLANFFVCHAPFDPSPADFLASLRGHGIKLRDCASFGLPGHVRLSVQPPASQDALLQAWELLV